MYLSLGKITHYIYYYKDVFGNNFKFQSLVEATVTGGVRISQNETEMAQWLLKNGPISIGINANGMQFYMGGVSHPWSFLCSKTSLDHGMTFIFTDVFNSQGHIIELYCLAQYI